MKCSRCQHERPFIQSVMAAPSGTDSPRVVLEYGIAALSAVLDEFKLEERWAASTPRGGAAGGWEALKRAN